MVTIFTPTYNRANIIDKLYNSLLKQTDKDFEWVVVDDGSSDYTETYFDELLKKENPFPIIYRKQANGGKHRAINHGVRLAKGEVFFIVDSDDYLTEDAIAKLKSWFLTLDGGKKWAGVSGFRGHTTQKSIGEIGKQKYIDTTYNKRGKYRLLGDKAEAYFTEVLRRYPFPEIEGENFLTEEVVWNAIACDGYYIRYFNEIIYICNYLEGGLTKSAHKNRNNPRGVLLWAKGFFQAHPNNLKSKLLATYVYYAAVKGTKKIKDTAHDLQVSACFVRFSIIIRKLKHLFR